MGFHKLRVRETTIVILLLGVLLIGTPYIIQKPVALQLQSDFSRQISSWFGTEEVRRETPFWVENLNLTHEEFPGLGDALSRAAMKGKTAILTTLNGAWAAEGTMIDLFLDSFRKGEGISHLLNHLIIITLDQKAHERCVKVHSLCFMLETEGVDFTGEKFFMSLDYLKMMWRRIDFLRSVLEMGYNFLFSDADIMWFRSPFPLLDDESDFQIACDNYKGDPYDLDNKPNGGFVYAQSNNRTIEFYKYWYMAREQHPGRHDQDVLNDIKVESEFLDIGLKLRFLNTLHFSGFCEVSNDLEKVCTMHANCCTSLERKLQDLRLVMDDWERFKSLTPLEKQNQRVFWRAPRECHHSWARLQGMLYHRGWIRWNLGKWW